MASTSYDNDDLQAIRAQTRRFVEEHMILYAVTAPTR
jgi:hypothetical protein